MELEVILPPSAESVSPIFITSPMNYCGGALLQRIACSSDNGFCFGDNFFDEILSQIDWAFELIERHQSAEQSEKNVHDLALERKPATWMPELALPLDIYTASLMSVIYNLPHTAQNYANDKGRDIWMVARSSITATRLTDILGVFPESKIIIIHRNPLDAIRDALRDRPGADVKEHCLLWNAMMREYLTFKSDRVLKIQYETAQENAVEFAADLGAFTGMEGITPDIVDAGSEAELESELKLDETLEIQIKELCADMLAVYYPHLVPDE